MVLIFVVGSTAGLTTMEYEPGLIKDLKELYERLVPSHRQYAHDLTWNDANGFSHLRSSLQGTSLLVPFKEKKLLLGTWQQVVLAEFDHRARTRRIILQFLGK
ncbi:MAG: secondary thiamine-phosphate synthase enzyme YjbQ [Candidatus Omnitrophica bacterium]|nr:secondary thiamine-phosphate synthase enzyme YjbQ [Candidatus Omnitrophota bacterium]